MPAQVEKTSEKTAEKKLPAFFGVKINPVLLSTVIVTLQKNRRTPVAHVRTRGEVRGGGRKPWRQKGTGRARHGSIRSPIWRGGGVTHGPRNDRIFSGKINQKAKNQALAMAFAIKKAAGEVIIVDSTAFLSSFRTKEAAVYLRKVAGTTRSLLLINDTVSPELSRSVRNLPRVTPVRAREVTPIQVLSHRKVVITHPALRELEQRLS
jgi:large subunit ribosomal protein L4